MVPISDWRIFCVADEEDLGGSDGRCAALKDAGVMDYKDYHDDDYSMAGARCKELFEHPEVLEAPPYTTTEGGAEWAWRSCYYGTAWDEAEDHYVQTMAAGWDMAADWTESVKRLTGWSGELEDINPAFIGNNQPPQ